MFAVIFEVNPRKEAWDAYLSHAAALRPELLAIDGFIANERYTSLHRPGWLVSLSIWRDEKALIRWRTHALHHEIQGKGRASVFADYHLRVGEIVADTEATQPLPQSRFDSTEVSAATAVSITERPLHAAPLPAAPLAAAPLAAVPLAAAPLAAVPLATAPLAAVPLAGKPAEPDLPDGADAPEETFDSITRPGNALVLRSWPNIAAAATGVRGSGGRHRLVRVIRDYGMFARAEAPQYFPAPPSRLPA
ncbi:MAG TPA: antibiotic biosynthesis monooxygenase [Rhodopila sp.]